MVFGEYADSDVAEIDAITLQRGQNTVPKHERKRCFTIIPYGQARIPVHTIAF